MGGASNCVTGRTDGAAAVGVCILVRRAFLEKGCLGDDGDDAGAAAEEAETFSWRRLMRFLNPFVNMTGLMP